MTEEDYLSKVITFENGKLLCDGEEISIEEAERIVQLQVKQLENNTSKELIEDDSLEREDIDRLSDEVTATRVSVSENDIEVRGINEYYVVARDILRGHEIADRALRFFSVKNKVIKREKKVKEELNVNWPGNINNDPNYQPEISEMSNVMINLFFGDIIYNQFKKQFNNPNLNIELKDINVLGTFESGFDVFIRNEKVDIYFRIDENENKFSNIDGNFAASSLRVGEYTLQNTTQNVSKGSNNIKIAQTVDNVIIKEIRFLKNTIKQEINFSLEQSISRAEERFNLARFFIINFELFIDRKTRKKLEKILKESRKTISENKKLKARTEEELEELLESTNEVQDSVDIESLIKKYISENFSIEAEKISINNKTEGNTDSYEIFLSGQKILLQIKDEEVSISSNNTIGTGKTDFQQNNISGKNLEDKIKNACFMATIPIFNRQIENITNGIKGKENKKSAKEIDKYFRECFNLLISNNNITDKAESIKTNLFEILDKLIFIGETINSDIFEIIDKILQNLDLQFFDILHIENLVNTKTYNSENGVLIKYKSSVSSGDSFIENIENIKKFINRIIYRDLIIYRVEIYKKSLSQEDFNKRLEELNDYENKINAIADYLSEDILLGGIARRLMALLDTSISSKNDLFKFNLDEIIIEMIKTHL